MDNYCDKDLIVRLHENDVDAFNLLYTRYRSQLYLNIFKLTRNTEAAQDILQEVFIILWEKRITVDPTRSVSDWLFTISYNKSINYLRRALKESVTIKNLEEEIKTADKKDTNLTEVQLYVLEKAVSQLSPQKRRVFSFCKLDGKSYEETAKELNISKHTVKEYLSEAVLNIKEYIKRFPESFTPLFWAVIVSSSM